MIVAFDLENWKSYRRAELQIEALTVVIGDNASGKSNVLDAILLLNRMASGATLTAALQGDGALPAMRGGAEWAARKPGHKFSLGIRLRFDDHQDLAYSIECSVASGRCEVLAERLERTTYRRGADGRRGVAFRPTRLFWTDPVPPDSPRVQVRLHNEKKGTSRQFGRANSVLSQLAGQKARAEVQEGVEAVIKALRKMFVLDVVPSHMRGFSALSDRLNADAGNIAGVLAGLTDSQRKTVEDTLTSYVSRLPETGIKRVYAEPIGRFGSDAMLYCEESFTGNRVEVVDARGMSDGTLRFIAILTAILTRPSGGLLIIKDVDKGLHPSRSELLLEVLRDVGADRGVDVMVTTHSPALLDAMSTAMVPFITVAHRNAQDGSSELRLLEDLDQLPKFLSSGPIGRLSSQGLIEQALRSEPSHGIRARVSSPN